MKPIIYYCHAINSENSTNHILKAVYNPNHEIAEIYQVYPNEDICLATLDTEGGLGEMALFNFCLDLMEEELGVTNIVKASLSEEKSYLIRQGLLFNS